MLLQPLRIPSGWEVILNKFSEIDVEDWSVDDENWMDLTEDITYLRRKGRRHEIGIDLGWYPDTDPKGAFHVKVIVDGDWAKPVKEYVTRASEDIVTTIEDLLLRYCDNYNIDLDVNTHLKNG